MNKIYRIKELITELNRLTELYDKGVPEISDKEWDDMYFELLELEQESKYVLPNSPTQKINYTIVNELQKVKHNHPMLSLDKTKNIEEIKSFVGNKDWIAMLKLDGLTCSLLYEEGRLVRAETRGDGEIGEDVTHNAMAIPSIPKRIKYSGRLVVDGEIICKLDDFEGFSEEYKNARNFASGSIRLLDSHECAKRRLTFVAWDIISGYEEECSTLNSKLEKLIDLNFEIVPFTILGTIEESTEWLKNHTNNYPIDGLVYKLRKCMEYDAMGRTDHHFRGGLAYKFYDELYETSLIDIEWTIGKTNTLTPTAIFETVNIDGTDVSKASLHNISIIKKLGLTNNCTVRVYKANQIIPQIDSCLNDGYSDIEIPQHCPVCNGKTEIVKENESEVLVCTNPKCSAKLLGRLKFFVSKPAMNIEGLSEATLEALINKGWVKSFKDIYYLYQHGREWEQLDGFGEKSVSKILDAIDISRKVKLENFICALSIDGIGTSASKTISQHFNSDFEAFYEALTTSFDWSRLTDFGEVTSRNIADFGAKNANEVRELAEEMSFIIEEKKEIQENPFINKAICVTGKLEHFTRDSINAKILELGAKVASGVSAKTDYLITNTPDSGSSKNVNAKKFGTKIITEEEFLKLIKGE